MESVARKQMQETRRKILELLKVKGPMSADRLSEELGISSMGTRQHLKALEHDDLISHRSQQGGMGRPGFIYSITEIGDELFPRAYSQMANSLLEAIKLLDGEDGIDRIFEKRTGNLKIQYQARMDGMSIEERIQELADIRTEEGYMADWEKLDADSFLLREHNCSICKIANECPQACKYELKLFQEVFKDAKVTREDHMIKGDQMCTYRIERKQAK
jgi:iron-sulfur cluster biosynthesis transcriptional regulator SufR